MKALVTGGAGFIGSNICAALLRNGAEVTILDDLSSGHAVNLDGLSNARFVKGDIRDPEAVARSVSGCEVVFHLAASVGNKRSIDHPDEDTAINVNGTLTVLRTYPRISKAFAEEGTTRTKMEFSLDRWAAAPEGLKNKATRTIQRCRMFKTRSCAVSLRPW